MAETLQVGTEFWFAWDAPAGPYSVVFEDDQQTGYLYAYDRSLDEQPILDAVHIYNVDAVVDRDIPSSVDVIWSRNGTCAALYLNHWPHAVFDFEGRIGFCRTNFPELGKGWDRGHWSEDIPVRYGFPERL